MGNILQPISLLQGVAGLVAAVAVFCNLPVSWWLPYEKATLKYLEDIELTTLDDKKKKFMASDLWKTGGAVIMAVRRPG